jgi:UDP-GlcNAc:undecaprenyl-phosphate/decaprenyl-phosphate GlcNAc-1-phosphate transferase
MISGANHYIFTYAMAAACALLLSLLANKWLISLSFKYKIFLDKPNKRSSHTGIVPRCGGLPICLIVLTGYLLFSRSAELPLIGCFLGALLIAVVGTIDDLISLPGKPKIVGMVVSSLLPVLFGLKLEYMGILLNNQPALYLLSFVWIYGFINAFNFMDGSDGLLGGSAAIGAFFMVVIAAVTGNLFVFGMALLLLAVCLGFLVFNYSPAALFLGDAGSMFLGYNFAVLGLLLTNNSANAAPIYLTIFIFAPLIYDSLVTFTRRGWQRKNVIEAHREHLYQRLLILGMSHRDVGLIYYGLALLLGLLGLLFFAAGPAARAGLAIVALAIMGGFSLAAKRLELSAGRKTGG